MAVAAAPAAAAPAAQPPSPPKALGPEDASLASETTRSFRQPDGSVIQRIYAAPVNVKDDRGAWKPLDTDLKADGEKLETKNTAEPISIPRRLGGTAEVKVGRNGHAFTLEPLGLQGTAEVKGDTATFAEAAPGVRAEIAALPEGVKQTFELSGSDAPTFLDLRLEVSDGLSVRKTKAGGASIVDRDGQEAFVLSPTFGWAKDKRTKPRSISTEITQQDGAWRVRADLSDSWIRDALRDGTVIIDPTATVPNPSQDAQIFGGTSSTGASQATGELTLIGESYQDKALLQFDTTNLPDGAYVQNAWVGLYPIFQDSFDANYGNDITIGEVTSSWIGAQVSHFQRMEGVGWGTAGGDYSWANADTQSFVSNGDTVRHWNVTPIAQRWLNGQSVNNGLVLAADNPDYHRTHFAGLNATGSYANKKPFLQVQIAPPAGQRRDDTYLSETLNDRSTLGIGVASGNALLSSQDIGINGVGLPLSFTRSFNSGLVGHRAGTFGNGGTSNLSGDVRLDIPSATGDALLRLGDGSTYRFRNTGTANFGAAARLEADLVRNTDSTFTLTYRQSQAKWTFRADGRLEKMADKNNTRVLLSYSTAASVPLVQIKDSQDRDLPVTVDAGGRITKIADPTGREWKYTYSGPAGDRLATYTDPENKVTSYVYNTAGQLTKITTPGGRITEIGYHPGGEVAGVKRVTNASASPTTGPTTSVLYDQTHAACPATAQKATKVTDPRGHQTTYCINNRLQVEKTIDATGHQQETKYTPDGQVEKFTDGTGTGSEVTNATYSSFSGGPAGSSRLTEVRGPMGETTTYGYSGGSGLTAQYQPSSTTGTDNQQQFFGYDGNGNVNLVKDHASSPQQQSTLTHNTNGTIATAKDGENRQTTYGYYVATDGGTRTGLMKTMTPPSPRAATTLDYDTLGRVKTATDGNSKTTAYTYDKLDRVKTIAFHGGSIMTYTYDDDGNQTQRVDSAAGTYGYSYDALNRRTGETLPGSRTVVYTYDASGNLTSLTDGSGLVGYGYDANNRNCYVAPLNAGGGSCTTPPTGATRMAYYPNGRPDTTTYPNGVVVKTTRDASGKPTEIKATNGATQLIKETAEYKTYPGSPLKTGERVSAKTFQGGTFQMREEYSYDSSDRLETIYVKQDAFSDVPGDWEEVLFSYDKAGNRTDLESNAWGDNRDGRYGHRRANDPSSSAYNAANQQAPHGATAYDLQGNSLTGLTYNNRNQTTALGTTALAYAGPNQSELITDGTKTVENNLLGKSRRIDGSNTTAWLRDASGRLLGRKAPGGVWSYYVQDRLGSVVGVTNASGALTAAYDYDVDGNALHNTAAIDFGYTGAYATGNGSRTVYHNSLRWYDPQNARWTQPDPLDQPSDLQNANPYVYVGGNPVNYVDPTGLSLLDDVGDFFTRDIDDPVKRLKRGASNIAKVVTSKKGRAIACGAVGGALGGLGGALAGNAPGAAAGAGAAGGAAGAACGSL